MGFMLLAIVIILAINTFTKLSPEKRCPVVKYQPTSNGVKSGYVVTFMYKDGVKERVVEHKDVCFTQEKDPFVMRKDTFLNTKYTLYIPMSNISKEQ